jgi:glycosyltransferase involved in cell wall biosynthesis
VNGTTKKLTIVIPTLDEGAEPEQTIKSIYDTAPVDLFDIIVIDDASRIKPKGLETFDEVRYVRNTTRTGVDASRTKGGYMAETPFILLIDAHMRFRKDNWCECLIRALEKEPATIFCTACVGLDKRKPKATVTNPTLGIYYGANILLFVHSGNDSGRPDNYRDIIEPKWLSKDAVLSHHRDFEVPCVLGGSYALSTDWFRKLKGLEGLRMWGSSECYLSLKSWLAGGRCKLIPSIRIGHFFRDSAPYSTQSYNLLYNKMFMAKSIFPEPLSSDLISFLGHNNDVSLAQRILQAEEESLKQYREYFESIFVKSIYEVCEYLNIDYRWPEGLSR